MTHDLIRKIFLAQFGSDAENPMNDAAALSLPGVRVAFSTDCHVVSPLFFPGGDIGRLAVCGTVNDLAMIGAKPLCITAGFILEEGLEFETLNRIAASMRSAADEAGIRIVAGDTKVVQKGKADGLYITTSGLGIISEGVKISGDLARPGDAVILSGSIGDHGIAVLSARSDLGFEMDLQSDVAPVSDLVQRILQVTQEIHVLRDPTRGGVATTLNEIARQSNVCIQIDEEKIPVKTVVRSACELYGFDPLYIANEGKFIAIAPAHSAEKILEVMQAHPLGKEAAIIGKVIAQPSKTVLMKTAFGTLKMLDMLSGELLPRIC